MRSPASLSMGMVTIGGPEDVTASSGAPTALLGALREVVAEVVAMSDAPGPVGRRLALVTGALSRVRPGDLLLPRSARERLRSIGFWSDAMTTARARAVRRRLAGHAPVDGLIQLGGDYRSPAGLPMVTCQDSTVLQAVRSYPWPGQRALSERDIARLARAQRQAYESAVACGAWTHWVAESIVADYQIPVAKVHVVGLGPNHEIAGCADPDERDWSRPRFLFVGFDWERKNGPRVLEAFANVRREVPDAQLDVVGGHPRLEMDGVVGHGRLSMDVADDRERIAQLYRRATVFVMPSKHEPAGVVYIEAAAAGIPSIGTSNGGAATCIGDGGYVVDPLQPRAITEAMRALCDPQTARSLGAKASEHAKLLTWRKMAERLIRAFGFPGLEQAGLAEFL
jgi:glycosyltransferase involved in cell wall biosynthesis